MMSTATGMGFTHGWKRPLLIPEGAFAAAALDCGCVLGACRAMGVALAGPLGVGEPVVRFDAVALNGLGRCGHPKDDGLGIVEPAADATGIAGPFEDVVVGEWLGGAVLRARKCPGTCSCDTFRVDRRFAWPGPREPADGLYTHGCKTAFRPYDLAVTSCLIVFQHHLGERQFPVVCSTVSGHWDDARRLVQETLAYGGDFRVSG
jgi:hypothetical protein